MKNDSRINIRAESPALLRMPALAKSTLSVKCRHTSDLSSGEIGKLEVPELSGLQRTK